MLFSQLQFHSFHVCNLGRALGASVILLFVVPLSMNLLQFIAAARTNTDDNHPHNIVVFIMFECTLYNMGGCGPYVSLLVSCAQQVPRVQLGVP